MIRLGLVFTAAALVGACAHSSLVLLSDEDGGHGSVAVLESNGKAGQAVVAQPNSRTKLGSQAPVVRPLGSKGLTGKETALLTELPPPARSFALYFQQGSTQLTPGSQQNLDSLRAEIARRPGAEVDVTGHTDTVGSEEDNDTLSLQRAQEVLVLLASHGIDRTVLTAVGRGERELREPTADGVASAINRRVEAIVR
jgi:outer membrane protein OmpA-like peptidoglycan-associated protein